MDRSVHYELRQHVRGNRHLGSDHPRARAPPAWASIGANTNMHAPARAKAGACMRAMLCRVLAHVAGPHCRVGAYRPWLVGQKQVHFFFSFLSMLGFSPSFFTCLIFVQVSNQGVQPNTANLKYPSKQLLVRGNLN